MVSIPPYCIRHSDIEALLLKYEINGKTQGLDRLFNSMDKNKDGLVDYIEFVKFIEPAEPSFQNLSKYDVSFKLLD